MSVPELRLAPGVPVAIDALVRAEDGGRPALATRVELVDDGAALHVRFDCDDPEPWSSLVARDAPLWQEEVVELFVAAGAATPTRYFEFEVNPAGALFDAAVVSPHGDRREMRVDPGWNCAGLEWSAELRDDRSGWRARLVVPWRSLDPNDRRERIWRANFFRIDRPRGASPEFSAWSPTGVRPADFHRPIAFGILARVG